ncbi:hypothetical protein [Archaeoglobus fulgidus]|uniref:Uncharacterized protein AF_0772 n=1 Tax=Archaeoglobus fulgidus (strain ATCC 49558 / DSM 4304 / JCM 9628 / NBRC 100126 / VC-16) TaxID=224325 RepID=Y772_ARCFU|nr:hypothetical protein [Archaeoglobus fulgidus]O29486.1 RecName: Full=Uncharacterized protein AF_0772 [Archaeoglobus fulgidus DSM 4304]AAB90476.1 predicted coding region AF_0772 [Archaeoglobus fulgidus DSM 4304]
MPVEGFITPDGVWTRGCLCMFADIDYTLNVFRGNPDEVVEQLRSAEKGRFNLLVYPLFYVDSRYSFLSSFLRLKMARNVEEASRIFKEAIYPINTLLRPFRDEKANAVSLNLFPLNFGIGKPKIAINGSNIGRSVILLTIDKNFGTKYDDFLPERGTDVEETKKILKKEFQFIEDVAISKGNLSIAKINNMSIREFLRSHNLRMRGDLENDVNREGIFGASPYILALISKETNGSTCLGLMDYNLKFYPSFFTLDIFYDEGLFLGEQLKGGLDRIKLVINSEKFDFIFVDQNIMLMFEDWIVNVFRGKDVYGVLVSFPSYTGKMQKRSMSEVEEKICLNTTLSTVFLNL